jgi:predicted RND superfamily exporter protein
VDILHSRLGDNMQLALYVSGAPCERLHRLADELADRALKLPQGAPRLVDYRPERMQEFFAGRRLLYANVQDLEDLEDRVEQRIAYEKKKANPFRLDLGEDERPPSFDDIFERYKEKASQLHYYPSGYYDGEDGQSLAMIFYAANGMTGYEASLEFRDRIHRLAKEVAAELGLQVNIQFTGDIESVIQEQHSLQADILTSTLIVLILEGLLLLAFYRWKPALLALGFPLAVGTLMTFAISYWVIGSLNASSAFLGSIIVGNGINPGIILLSRYVEERRRGLAPRLAMTTAMRGCLVPTLVASAAAAVSYASLMITDFRGYSHFGFMGGVGMILCWISTYLLLPPVAVAVDTRWPLQIQQGRESRLDRAFGAVGAFGVQRARAIGFGTLALTLIAAIGIARIAPDPIDHDTTHLRSKWATERGGTLEVDQKVDAILKRVLTPVVILVSKESEVVPLARAYQDQIRLPNREHLLGEVLTLQSLVPADQERKAEIVNRVRKQLRPDRLARLDEKTRQLVRDWLPAADVAPFTARDLPEDVRRQFRESDGSEGNLVLVFPKHGLPTTDGRIVTRIAAEAREVPLPQGAIAAGSYLVFADMFEAIAHDGPIATAAALIAVVLLSLALARGAKGTFAVTASLFIGVLWTVGIAGLWNTRFNFLNFIALPITFGIGVDYAANIFGRFRASASTREDLIRALSSSGAAVAVCSGTTVIGYSSLLFSRNQALFSFGALSVLGEIACLTAALLVLPALLGRHLTASSNSPQPMPPGLIESA